LAGWQGAGAGLRRKNRPGGRSGYGRRRFPRGRRDILRDRKRALLFVPVARDADAELGLDNGEEPAGCCSHCRACGVGGKPQFASMESLCAFRERGMHLRSLGTNLGAISPTERRVSSATTGCQQGANRPQLGMFAVTDRKSHFGPPERWPGASSRKLFHKSQSDKGAPEVTGGKAAYVVCV
jgi:hypothetical protein